MCAYIIFNLLNEIEIKKLRQFSNSLNINILGTKTNEKIARYLQLNN